MTIGEGLEKNFGHVFGFEPADVPNLVPAARTGSDKIGKWIKLGECLLERFGNFERKFLFVFEHTEGTRHATAARIENMNPRRIDRLGEPAGR